MVIYGNSCLIKKKKGTTTMKAYIKPNTTIVDVELQDQLLTISGTGNQLQGGSNGEYTNEVTLGARRNNYSVWGEEDEEF